MVEAVPVIEDCILNSGRTAARDADQEKQGCNKAKGVEWQMYHDEKEFAGLVTVNLTPKGDNRNNFC
jgi:hypothetical protein